MPWAESPAPLDAVSSSESASRQRPTLQEFREARLGRPWANGVLGRRALDAQTEAQAESQVNSIFGLEIGGQPLAQRDAELRDAEQRFWHADSRRLARARFNTTYRRDRGYDFRPPQRGSGATDDLTRAGGSVLPPNTRSSSPRYNSRLLRSSRDRRNAMARNVFGLDGLGDRERSLSPEVWDTLLTTLTPDPQPPSAGSSFASVAASQSQSAGPSSSTPTSAPDIIDGPAMDGQCDSDCGHSDADMDEDEENIDVSGMRLRVPSGRDEARQTNPYNLDSIVNGSGSHPGAVQPQRSSSSSNTAAANNNSNNNNNSELGAQFGDMFTSISADVPRPPASIARILRQREQTAQPYQSQDQSAQQDGPERVLMTEGVRAEGDESPMPRQSNGASGVTSGATSGGEEDWSGMQRIVRSLARREDIPDEWWAEVGLSRTLPQDETTNG
ncbi:hypothetical protein JDV02_006986 [Purpureocillium takamizusanense]|nr:uncharacterized protein JDV02_006986 [Purpureocillium takamizusanense]UNI20942.1 hypothetical protein JDV02_006986 [Purpureocillium takamizusanense]